MLNSKTAFPVDKIAPPVAFVLVGFVMIITAGSGRFPFFTGNNPLVVEEPWRTILGLLGIFLTVVGPVLGWLEIRNWQERRSREEKEALPFKEYGITLEQKYYETKGHKIEISGTYKIKPPPNSLRTIIVTLDRTRFWPQHIVQTFDEDKKIWRCSVYLHDPGGITVYVVIVGKIGFHLWEYYCRVAQETDNKVHIPFVSLPEDTFFCGESKVNRLS